MGEHTTTAYIVGCHGEVLGVFATEGAAASHRFPSDPGATERAVTVWISPVPAFGLYTAAQVAEAKAKHKAELAYAVVKEREACAQVARHGCLVPPDGGSPSQSEVDLCDHIATIILERGKPMPPFEAIRERGE
jgi:hypothetical protein